MSRTLDTCRNSTPRSWLAYLTSTTGRNERRKIGPSKHPHKDYQEDEGRACRVRTAYKAEKPENAIIIIIIIIIRRRRFTPGEEQEQGA